MSARKKQKLWPGPVAQASLVACPVCSKQVPLQLINSHLDTSCQLSTASPAQGQPSGSSPARHRAQQALAQPKSTKSATATAAASITQQPSKATERHTLPHQHQAPSQPAAASTCEIDGYRLTLFQPTQPADKQLSNSIEPASVLDPRQGHTDEEPGSDRQKAGVSTAVADEAVAHPAFSPEHSAEEEEQHQRTLQQAASRQTLLRRLQAGGHAALQGHSTVPNFVSPAEEAALLQLLDTGKPDWKDSTFNGRHRGKAWGVRMDLKSRKVLPAAVPLPPLLQELAARMRADVPALRNFHPTESNAIDYVRNRGHSLQPHVDDRQMSTGEIVTLSLLGACTMTFQTDGKKGGSQTVRVHLPPRTLQVLTGRARYNFTHAIQLKDLEDERRVSITFRQSPVTG